LKYLKNPLVVAALMALVSTQANASDTSTGSITIVRLANNWSENTLAVFPANPVINPDGCSIASFYSTNASNPGNQLMQALLTSAFMGGRSVTLTVSGCYEGYPEIISVQINPS